MLSHSSRTAVSGSRPYLTYAMENAAMNVPAFPRSHRLAVVFGLLFALTSTASLADSNVLRGPITFGPDARIKLDCPREPSAANAVRSDVQGFGHVSAPVRFKLVYRSGLYAAPIDVPGSEQQTRDYLKSLNSYLRNFPGPGYYSLVMRNNTAYPVSLPAHEQIGIICQ